MNQDHIYEAIIGFSVGVLLTMLCFLGHAMPTEWKDGGVIIHDKQAYYLREVKDAK